MRSLPYIRAFFALLLLAAGVAKVFDIDGFYAIVEEYKLLPWLLIIPGAWALIAAEIGLALWLVSGRALPQAACAVVLLHSVYLVWITIAAVRGLEIANCGCFGVYWARPLSAWTFVEDVVLILLAAFFAVTARQASPQIAAAAFR